MCVCVHASVCVRSDGINSRLGGPVGSCWEQETGADMAAWCTRWLKWDETTWPPEEPINYTKSPATVKLTARLWQISEERLDPANPTTTWKRFHDSDWIKRKMIKFAEKHQKSWDVCCLAIRRIFQWRMKCCTSTQSEGERGEGRQRESVCETGRARLTVTGRIFNRPLPESIVEQQLRC